MEDKDRGELDILKHTEELVERLNNEMGSRGKSVFRRYPITFSLLVLVGVIAVSEAIKDIVYKWGIFEGHPWYLLALGLFILVLTGSLYKRLDK